MENKCTTDLDYKKEFYRTKEEMACRLSEQEEQLTNSYKRQLEKISNDLVECVEEILSLLKMQLSIHREVRISRELFQPVFDLIENYSKEIKDRNNHISQLETKNNILNKGIDELIKIYEKQICDYSKFEYDVTNAYQIECRGYNNGIINTNKLVIKELKKLKGE